MSHIENQMELTKEVITKYHNCIINQVDRELHGTRGLDRLDAIAREKLELVANLILEEWRENEANLCVGNPHLKGGIEKKSRGWLPLKLRVLTGADENNLGHKTAGYGYKSLAALAKKHDVERADLSRILAGKRNTARLCNILVTEWHVSIHEIREIYKEHHARNQAGNPVTWEETKAWHKTIEKRWMAALKGMTIPEYEAWKIEQGMDGSALEALSGAFKK